MEKIYMKVLLKKYFIGEKILQFCIASFLFLLPWQTIFITEEKFLNGSKWQYGTLGFYATEILLWLGIFSFYFFYIKKVFAYKKEGKIKFSWTSDRLFIFSVLLFLLYCFTSTFWSIDRSVAWQQALFFLEAFLFFFILYLGPIDFKYLAKYFIAGAVLQSLLGIYQFLTQSTFAFKWLGLVSHPVFQAGTSIIEGDVIGRILRAYGAFSHPNVFAGYLFVSLVATTLLFLKEAFKNISQLFFQVLVFAIQVIALFFTFSRSSWIAFGLFFLGLFLFFLKNKLFGDVHIFNKNQKDDFVSIKSNFCKKNLSLSHLFITFFFLVSLLTLTYWPLIHTRIANQSSHEIQSTQERVVGYKEALQLWRRSSWIGVGAGNYTRALYENNPNRPGYEYQPVHNVPLLFLTEFGIFGIVFLFGIIISFCRFALQNSQQKYSIFFFISLLLILSLFDHYLYSSYIGTLLFALYFSLVFRFLLEKEQK